MATEGTLRLTIYTRAGCHLCDEMVGGLRRLQRDGDFEFDVVDVDRQADLTRRYGDRVPVLAVGKRELCYGRLDTAALTAFLQEVR